MKHTFKKSLSMLMAAVMSVQMFLPAVSHAVESAPEQPVQSVVQTMDEEARSGNRQFDDRDSAVKYSKEWNRYDEAGHFNNTITYTTSVGATMDFTFKGTGVVLYAQKTFNSGTMEISVDGEQVQKVDFYSPLPNGEKRAAVYMASKLDPNVEHTLHAVLLEEKNSEAGARQVALDAVTVMGYDAPPVDPALPGEAIVFQSAFDKGETGEWGHQADTKVELAQDDELGKQVLKITPSAHEEVVDLLSAGKVQNGRLSFKIKGEYPLGLNPFVRHQAGLNGSAGSSGLNGTFAGCWSNGWWLGDETKYNWIEFSKAPNLEGTKWRDVTFIFNGSHYAIQYDGVEWEGDRSGLNLAPGYCGIQIRAGENKLPVYISDLVVTTIDPVRIEPDTAQHDNNMKLWYTEPGYNWETQALPLGNGFMGAMYYGQVTDEKIQINDKTLWQGGPGGVADYTGGVVEGAYKNLEPMRKALREGNDGLVRQYANGLIGKNLSTNGWGAYQNIGDILFHFDGFKTGDVVTNYRRELDLNTGLGGVTYTHNGVNFAREYLVSYPDNVMAFRFTADQDGKLGFVLDPQIDDVYPAGMPDTPPNVDPSKPCKTFTRTAEGALITVRGVVVENKMEFEVQYRVVTDGTVTANEDGTLTIANASDAVVYVATGTNYANESTQWTELHNPPDYRGEDPHADITARINNAVEKGYAAVKAAHVADVNGVMGRVELDIAQGENNIPTDQLVKGYGANDAHDRMAEMLMFQMGRYMILGSSRDGSLPANLQGVWNNSNKPAWSGDYHCNVNLQMNYWPTGIANVDEATQSLVDYMETVVVPGRFTAAEHHGVKDGGWTVHTSNNPFGMTAPGWSFYWGWSPAANAWMCQNLWDVYQFNQDEQVLKDQIYPIMREAAEFWTKNLVDDGKGGLVSSPTYSPEHGPITEGNAYEQCLIYQLMNDTIEAAEALGIRDTEDKEFCDLLADIKSKLHPYAIGKWGQIKEWREEDEWETRFTHGEERYHRHMSHMLGLYPGNQITRDTPELLEAAKVTLTDRGNGGTGWSKALKVSNWARVGDGNHALLIFKEFMKNNVYTNLFAFHPPYQIDGNLGITAGAAEMLLQSHTGYIQPLPALPDDWAANGSVKGLVARGNFVVDMSWTDAQLQTMDVTARSGGTCRIYLPDFQGNLPTDSKGQTVNASYKDDILSFDTVEGETYHYTVEVTDPDQAKAGMVDTQIAAIGEVKLESEEEIQAARTAYEALTAEQKAMVKNLDVLTAAEATLEDLKAHYEENKAAAAAVDQLIAAIGEVKLESEQDITAAREAYEALTDPQKDLVTKLAVLEQAEADLKVLKDQAAQVEADKKAAAQVDAQIAAIGKVTLESEQDITAAREAYKALTDAQKQYVAKLAVLEQAEADLKALKDQAAQSEKDKKLAAAVDAKIEAIGEVTLASEQKIHFARVSYNNLTKAQKALVTKLDVLIAAEKKLEELKNPVEPEVSFPDVAKDDWFYAGVMYSAGKGLMNGLPDGTFGPKVTMTRAQLVQMLYAMEGKPTVASVTDKFSDVKAGDWFADAVTWAVEANVTGGVGAGTFAPNAQITRQEMAVMLYAYKGRPAAEGKLDFADKADIADWAAKAVVWAVDNGLMNSVSTEQLVFSPKSTATRAEAAIIMMNLDKLGK